MKELLRRYAAYNLWANERIITAMLTLSHDQHHQEVINSFNTLYKTLFHVWGAGNMWWRRFQKEKNIVAPADDFSQSMQALTDAWKEQDMQWLGFTGHLDDKSLNETLTYRNTKGDEFCEPVFLILHHLFNHSTYHRGQMVTIFRQLGMQSIPGTDFIAWVRMTNQ
jgi:uncharacterized damage-inducible protein DinB